MKQVFLNFSKVIYLFFLFSYFNNFYSQSPTGADCSFGMSYPTNYNDGTHYGGCVVGGKSDVPIVFGAGNSAVINLKDEIGNYMSANGGCVPWNNEGQYHNPWYGNQGFVYIVEDEGFQPISCQVQNKVSPTLFGNSANNYLNSSSNINVDYLISLIESSGNDYVFNLNNGKYFDIVFRYFWSNKLMILPFSGQISSTEKFWYQIRFRIYHGKDIDIANNNFSLCTNKGYPFSHFLNNIPFGYVFSSVSNVEETVFLNSSDNKIYFNQTSLNQTVMNISFAISGVSNVLVTKNIPVTVGDLKESYFISTINSGGVVTVNDPPVQLSNYVYSNGGVLEFAGPGVQYLSTQYYFNPSMAQTNNVVKVRSINNGCVSDWRDTLFVVSPLITNLSTPIFVGAPTITGGLFGNLWVADAGTQTFLGIHKFMCAGESVVFDLPAEAGITYEWLGSFHNGVYISEEGNSISFNLPSDSIIYQNTSNILNLNQVENAIIALGLDSLISLDFGDVLEIKVRKKNVLGDYSNWSNSVFIGIVNNPIKTNVLDDICMNSDTIALTTIKRKSDFNLSYDYSFLKADWNLDGFYDLDETESVSFPIKKKQIYAEFGDTIKYRWRTYPSLSQNIYVFGGNTVCKSKDTFYLVNPSQLNVGFNVEGILPSHGTAVNAQTLGGNYYSSSDSIFWNWSDGSETYSGTSHWHHLNDLGSHSLFVTIKDTFGCENYYYYEDLWYVPGVLDVEELTFDNFVIYPNPASDYLQIKSPFVLQSEDIEVYDLVGKEYLVKFNPATSRIDLNSLSSGFYLLRINKETHVKSFPFQIK